MQILDYTRHKGFVLGFGFALAAMLVPSWARAVTNVIAVGREKQLFLDDLFFRYATNVSLRLHPARKTGERVLTPDQPWENASLNWFSVLQEKGKFRMWYECYDVEGWPTTDDTSFCYAESGDGRHWTKPKLNLFTYHGNTRNNILFREIGPTGAHSRVHGTGVFLDPTASPEARYKCVSQGMFAQRQPPYRIAGMTSPDGLRWTRLPDPICDVFADSQYSTFWDAGLNAYVLYGRVNGRGRALGRTVSRYFTHFEPPQLVLENEPTRDLYNPAGVKYAGAANAYLMFPSVYDHRSDTLEIHLAVSRDGIHWRFPDLGTPFISLGAAGGFDSGSLYLGQGIINVGNELWHYYSGSPLKHQQANLDLMTQPANRRLYSRAVLRLDGYVSVQAGEHAGILVTPPLRIKGSRLELNVAVQTGGSLLVGILDTAGNPIPGLSPDDCVPVTGDQIRQRVQWRSKTKLASHSASSVCLTFRMTRADLFAFQFRD